MTQSRPTPIPATRAALAGLSALLVVSVIMGSSLKAMEPALRDTGRESTHRDLAPARQFSATLAKAVRQLVGGDQHKPAMLNRGPARVLVASVPVIAEESAEVRRGPEHLRAALLDLPPPAPLA